MNNRRTKELGRRLRERREELRLSTRDVAERAETTHGTIVRLEQGTIEKPAADAAKAEYDHLRETAGERKTAIQAKIDALKA